MSSTNRGAARRGLDFYATPASAIDPILEHLPLGGMILEPCAGEGAIVQRLLARGVPPTKIVAAEIDDARAETCARETQVHTFAIDALVLERPDISLVITNPPFSRALAFAAWAVGLVAPMSGTVALLLRLGFLESEVRSSFHREHPADVYVLRRRPSFTGKGSDSTGYAWFVWGPGRGGRWSVL